MKIHYIFCAHFLCLILFLIPGLKTLSAQSAPYITAGGSTSICEGGSVLLTAKGSSGTDLDYLSFSIGTVGTDQWQSFTPGIAGSIQAITVRTNGCSSNIATTFTLYEGIGTDGTIINSQLIVFAGCNYFHIIELSDINLELGTHYTFRLESSSDISLLANSNAPGSYYSNSYGLNPGWKLSFSTNMTATLSDVQWFINDVLIEGAITLSYNATSTGDYTAKSGTEGNYSPPSNIINVNDTPPITPVITAGGPISFCDPGSVTLTASVSPVTDLAFGSSNLGTFGTNQWQSFVPTLAGMTTAIRLYVGGSSNQTLSLYEGIGINGNLIYSAPIAINGPAGLYTINIPGGINLTAGVNYTFQISGENLFLQAIQNSTYGSYFSDVYGLNPPWRLNFQTVVTPFFSPQWYQNGVLIDGANSGNYEATTAGVYTNVNTLGVCLSDPSNEIIVNATCLPPGWSQSVDGINCNDGNNIKYNPDNQVWTATSTNCYYANPYTSDAMAFAQHTLCGNGSITAQVTGISGNASGWAGITIRENNDAGAKKVQLSTNMNSNLNRREVRYATNGQAFPQQFPAQNRFWLRIVRTGNQFVGYSSANGVNWFPVLSVNVSMTGCVQVGLVLNNYSPNSTVYATFANVSVTGNFETLPSINNQYFATPGLSEKSHDFDVYPNPTSGELYIDLPSYSGKSIRIELFNMQGQMLHLIERDETVLNHKEQLDLTGYAAGIYFVKLKSAGLPDVTKRVVLLQGNQNRP
jgi:hypothetical protein